jgi:glycosyltransferase involved in cell wall biosynthesis
MKVAIDGRILEYEKGGMYRILFNLVKYISENRDKNTYTIFFSDEIPDLDFLSSRNIVCKKIKGPRILRKWYTFCTHVLLPLCLWREEFDLFYGPYYFGPIINPVKKVVLSPWDISFTTHPGHYTYKIGKQLDIFSRLTNKKANGLVTCSEYDKKIISTEYDYPLDKIHVLKIAVDDNFKLPPEKELVTKFLYSKGLKPGYLLSVGTIYKRRNIDKLLLALIELKKQDKEIKLVLLGRNNIAPKFEIEKFIEKNELHENVYRQERVTDEELIMFYSGAQYCYCTSTVDGESIILKESLALGTPILVNNNFKETIGGYCAEVRNPENYLEIVVDIKNAFKNIDANRKISEKGREFIVNITWEKTCSNLIEFLNNTAHK